MDTSLLLLLTRLSSVGNSSGCRVFSPQTKEAMRSMSGDAGVRSSCERISRRIRVLVTMRALLRGREDSVSYRMLISSTSK